MPDHPDRPTGAPEGAEATPPTAGDREPSGESVRSRAAAEAARRKRRAAVFGDVLPEGTSDERGDAWGESAGGNASGGNDSSGGNDEWLRRQVPPHHG